MNTLTSPWKPTLAGRLVRLRPLTEADWPALFEAASDPLIWEQHPEPTRWQEAVFRRFFEGALAADGGLVVLDAATGAVIGSSRYHAHDPLRREVEIGWTFVARTHWGGAANAEMKSLMLAHAFGHVDRVLFRVGPGNARSQAAMRKIGGRCLGRVAGPDGGASVVFEMIAPHRRPPPLQPLTVDRLRPLTLRRGFVSAASGLVCARGAAIVASDDGLSLARFDHAQRPGHSHALLPGRLPAEPRARKAAKPDFECLLQAPDGSLIAMGSGSRANRCQAVTLPWGADRALGTAVPAVDLAPLYGPLVERWQHINIEGAFFQGDRFMLLNRGVAQVGNQAPNAMCAYDAQAALAVLQGRSRAPLLPREVRTCDLGVLDGVPLAFTDGKALPAAHGGWLFAAAAEDRDNSYDDGACRGSAIGIVSAGGQVQALWQLDAPFKVEGIDWRQEPDGSLAVFMVTDADDATQPAWLLSARLPASTLTTVTTAASANPMSAG